MSYEIVESNDRVPNIEPALRTRFRWRAERELRRRNRGRILNSYHWRVEREIGSGRFVVVAYQNYLKPVGR